MKTINKTKSNSVFDTKEIILQRAGQLFSKWSYVSVSMDEVAKLVKISKPALYYHFKNKRDLFCQVINRSFQEFCDLLQEPISQKDSLEERLRKALLTYINFCLKKKNLVQMTIQKISKLDKRTLKFVTGMRAQIIEQFEPLVKEILSKKNKMTKTNSHLVTYLLIGSIDAFVAHKALANNSKWTSKQIVDQVIALAFGS